MDSSTVQIPNQDRSQRMVMAIIATLSIAIPLVVALLLYIPQTGNLGAVDVSFLPVLNATLNSATAICLIIGYVLTKQGKYYAHRSMMLSAFTLSSIFLVSYVIYHFQAASTKFGDLDHNGLVDAIELAKVGSMRTIYFVLLLSHIVLAACIVPLVLLSIYFGLTRQFDKHKKVSKFTFPLWLYVAITGVVVYLLISPYYNHG
jgi:putative membrane protein